MVGAEAGVQGPPQARHQEHHDAGDQGLVLHSTVQYSQIQYSTVKYRKRYFTAVVGLLHF